MNSIRRPILFGAVSLVVALFLFGGTNSVASGLLQSTARSTSRATVIPPTATQVVVLDTNYELLYPMLVRFNLALRLAISDVKSVRLKIWQSGAFDQIFDIPYNQWRANSADSTFVTFAWPLTATNAPDPFRTMRFQWEIVTVRETVQSIQIEFEFSDKAHQWSSVENTPLMFFWYSSGLNVKYASEAILRAYTLLKANTGFERTYKFVIYEPSATSCETDTKRPGQGVLTSKRDGTIFPCDPQNIYRIYGARGYTVIQRTTPLLEQLQDDIIAVMVRDALAGQFAKNKPPEWFLRGLTQTYSLLGRPNALLLARDIARRDRLLAPDALVATPDGKVAAFSIRYRDWHAQAFMFTLYLSAKYGAQTPFTLARDFATSGDFEKALAGVTNGATLTDLFSSYQTWILTSDADLAIRWNPYLLTPTATITPTETLYPSFTPFTPTVTETPTEFPSVTPRPTITPTRVPPTNTARPPGSLETPTAQK